MDHCVDLPMGLDTRLPGWTASLLLFQRLAGANGRSATGVSLLLCWCPARVRTLAGLSPACQRDAHHSPQLLVALRTSLSRDKCNPCNAVKSTAIPCPARNASGEGLAVMPVTPPSCTHGRRRATTRVPT